MSSSQGIDVMAYTFLSVVVLHGRRSQTAVDLLDHPGDREVVLLHHRAEPTTYPLTGDELRALRDVQTPELVRGLRRVRVGPLLDCEVAGDVVQVGRDHRGLTLQVRTADAVDLL